LFGEFRNGYTVVRLEGAEEVVSVAPAVATLYVAPHSKLVYKAPQTRVPVGLIAREVFVSGDFLKDLSLRGRKVVGGRGSRCRSDLNVYAIEYIDYGFTVDGKKATRAISKSQ
jgi:hypothetical protein